MLSVKRKGGIPYNQLLNKDSLADTSTTEQTNLTTTSIRSEKIDDLDTGDENLTLGRLLGEGRSLGVDGGVLGSLDGTALVDGVTGDVDDAAKGTGADGDHDGVAGVEGVGTTGETLSTWRREKSWRGCTELRREEKEGKELTIHSNGSDDIFTEMLLIGGERSRLVRGSEENGGVWGGVFFVKKKRI